MHNCLVKGKEKSPIRRDLPIILIYTLFERSYQTTGPPYTIGEKTCIAVYHGINIDCHVPKFQFGTQSVTLSNDTIQRRIDEMGDDVELQLVQILSRTDHAH